MLSRVSTQYATPASGQLAFLRRVAQDDKFRARLEADPQTAMAEYGLDLDPQDLPSKVVLPSNEAVRQSLEYLETSDPDRRPIKPTWIGLIDGD